MIDVKPEDIKPQEAKPGHNPYALAAEFQQKLVSIHPYNDGNGRLSRLIMNWSLENDGVSPSVLSEPDNDILLDQETWVKHVKQGSEQYSFNQQRREALEHIGYKNVAEIMGLDEEKTFYDDIYQYVKQAPQAPEGGEAIDHSMYEQFLSDLEEEMKRFDSEFRSERNSEVLMEVSQGGLIPQALIDLAGRTPNDKALHSQYLQERFLSKQTVYRGGKTTDFKKECAAICSCQIYARL